MSFAHLICLSFSKGFESFFFMYLLDTNHLQGTLVANTVCLLVFCSSFFLWSLGKQELHDTLFSVTSEGVFLVNSVVMLIFQLEAQSFSR